MKRRRQQAIHDLVQEQALGSQAAILKALHLNGFEATQPTVSRDLEELGLVRVRDDGGRFRYAPPDASRPTGTVERARRVLDEFVVGMESSRNIVVVRTPPGAANTVAQSLDQAGLRDVIGTVAGDDTILVVAREGVRGTTVMRRLEQLMEGAA